MKFLLIDVDYTRFRNKKGLHEPLLRLYGINIEDNSPYTIFIQGFRPYFYVDCSITKAKRTINRLNQLHVLELSESTKVQYFGGDIKKLTKITLLQPWKVPKLRDLFKSKNIGYYEADIPFNKRFLLDTRLRTFQIYDIPEKKQQTLTNTKTYHKLNLDYIGHLSVFSLDIEVDTRGETIQKIMKEKTAKITAISCCFGFNEENYSSKVFILPKNTLKAERRLLENFIAYIKEKDPTVIVTFNGTSFDWPYLLARLNKHNIPVNVFSRTSDPIYLEHIPVDYYRIRGRMNIDLVPHTWGLHPVSGKKGLNDIAQLLLEETKIDIVDDHGILWKKGFIDKDINKAQRFKAYSIQDAELTYKLYWKLQLPNKIDLLQISGYPAAEGIHTTGRNIGEFELMRLLNKRNILIPNKPSNKELEKRKEYRKQHPHIGGYVIEPNKAIADQVIICDFLSMYPSLIQAHNIGGEVLKDNADTLSPKDRFHKNQTACLALLEEQLLLRRKKVKEKLRSLENSSSTSNTNSNISKIKERLNKKQKSIKLVANSLYGSHNYVRGRFYSAIISNSITEIGHEYIKNLEIWTLEYGNNSPDYSLEVVYGDTDSVFVKYSDTQLISSLREKRSKEDLDSVIKEVNKYVKAMNAKMSSTMNLELEDIALRILFKPGRKKAYSYLSAFTNKVIIKGFEAVRSDWSYFAREGQRLLLRLLLNQQEINIVEAKKFVLDFCKKMLNMKEGQFKEKAIILGNIRRVPRAYKSKTPVVGAFIDYCKKTDEDPNRLYLEYDRFPYVIEDRDKSILAAKAVHPKYSTKIDRYHYIKEVLAAVKRFGIVLKLPQVKFYARDGPLLKYFK